MTISMSLVDLGTPCAELANDPVTKYGTPDDSSATRSFSKTALALKGSSSRAVHQSQESARHRVVRIFGMSAPDPVNGGFPYRITQLNGNLRTARWSENSVQFEVNHSGFRRRVGYSHAKTIPCHHRRPENNNSADGRCQQREIKIYRPAIRSDSEDCMIRRVSEYWLPSCRHPSPPE